MYTYQNLDTASQSMFTEEKWFLKNQFFADIEQLELSAIDVGLNVSSSAPSQT